MVLQMDRSTFHLRPVLFCNVEVSDGLTNTADAGDVRNGRGALTVGGTRRLIAYTCLAGICLTIVAQNAKKLFARLVQGRRPLIPRLLLHLHTFEMATVVF